MSRWPWTSAARWPEDPHPDQCRMANYACALDSTGAAYCWGNNDNGQLGDGSTTDSSVPVAVDISGVLAGKTLTQITVGR